MNLRKYLLAFSGILLVLSLALGTGAFRVSAGCAVGIDVYMRSAGHLSQVPVFMKSSARREALSTISSS